MPIIIDTIASASQRDYDWLKASIAKWNGNRSDLAALTPDFVMLAEKRINGDLSASAQESTAQISVPAGAVSGSLPADTGEVRSLSIIGGAGLDYLTPATFNGEQWQGMSGTPRFFTAVGAEIFLGPLPDKDCTLLLTYKQYVPALADSAGTNWLIENHPEVYLAACMVESIHYTKNFDNLQIWEAKYEAALAALNKAGSFTGTMRIRTDARIA